MKPLRFFLALALSQLLLSPIAFAQFDASAEHRLLSKEIGEWKASIKLWMGPDGKTDPQATPIESQGTETNEAIGEFWILSRFKGEFGGLPFEGVSTNGFDPSRKKYVGTWVDSMSPFAMKMEGEHAKDSDTLTYLTEGVGFDGQPVKGKMVMKYINANARVATMYDLVDGQELRSMEIQYTRAK